MSKEDKKNGGKRPGSGRKHGTGTYMEATSVIRVPDSQKPVIASFLEAYAKKQRLRQMEGNLDSVGEFAQLAETLDSLSLPLYQSKVPAGLPSPADSDEESRMDPNGYLIQDPANTFFVTIQGESMIEAGLLPGDKAIVNKRKQASIGDIVLAMIDGEFTIKTLAKQKNGDPKLLPANSSGKYEPILIQGKMQFAIWGVVTGSFRKF
ncbi:LexA family transcriptional regulator [Methylophilus sp. Leaf414]|uniref:LexA family protein n=1 Tax=Methylophilus sp. Leaf414 TaxID=1736371 RepID=UPI0006F65765|nr:S24 family peptidase [Methylophilus sp. Leaf414]KQT36321.1 peptidase S24 [Methylophilus sp. Leaf414]